MAHKLIRNQTCREALPVQHTHTRAHIYTQTHTHTGVRKRKTRKAQPSPHCDPTAEHNDLLGAGAPSRKAGTSDAQVPGSIPAGVLFAAPALFLSLSLRYDNCGLGAYVMFGRIGSYNAICARESVCLGVLRWGVRLHHSAQ